MKKDKNQYTLGALEMNSDDQDNFPQMQISYMGKTCDAVLMQPYGLTSRPIPEKTLLFVGRIQGQEQNRSCLATVPYDRHKGLKDGEVVLENMLRNSEIFLDDDGNMVFKIPKDRIETVQDVQITASNVDITASGNYVVTSANATFTTTLFTINGALAVTGAFACNGQTPQTPISIDTATGANNTSVINQIRSLLISFGLAQ